MSSKQRNYRKRKVVEEPEEEEARVIKGMELKEMLKETRELQKMRSRAKGIGADSLCGAEGSTYATTAAKDELGEVLQDTFATHVEEATTAEERRMQKYVEDGMRKVKGITEEDEMDDETRRRVEVEKDLYSVPSNLEGMDVVDQDAEGANGFMSGIVEVQLSSAYKIKNIQETEAAKAAMLARPRGPRKEQPQSYNVFGDFKGGPAGAPRAMGRQGTKPVASDDMMMQRWRRREMNRK